MMPTPKEYYKRGKNHQLTTLKIIKSLKSQNGFFINFYWRIVAL